ncbi:hypothetical protein Tco_0135111 [Tanacetum coccineum]
MREGAREGWWGGDGGCGKKMVLRRSGRAGVEDGGWGFEREYTTQHSEQVEEMRGRSTGFTAALAILEPEHLKADKTRVSEFNHIRSLPRHLPRASLMLALEGFPSSLFKYFGRLCPNEIYRLISLALDSISALLLFGDWRLERTATFSISTISE